MTQLTEYELTFLGMKRPVYMVCAMVQFASFNLFDSHFTLFQIMIVSWRHVKIISLNFKPKEKETKQQHMQEAICIKPNKEKMQYLWIWPSPNPFICGTDKKD